MSAFTVSHLARNGSVVTGTVEVARTGRSYGFTVYPSGGAMLAHGTRAVPLSHLRDVRLFLATRFAGQTEAEPVAAPAKRPAPVRICAEADGTVLRAFVGERCGATAVMRRIYSHGPLWTVARADGSPCGSAEDYLTVRRILRREAGAFLASTIKPAPAPVAMVAQPVQQAQGRDGRADVEASGDAYADDVVHFLCEDAAEAFNSGEAAVREVRGASGAWVRLGTVAGAIVAGLCPYGASAATWDPGLLADGSPERNALALALWVAFLLFSATLALCGLDIAARSTRLRSLRALPEAEPVRRRVLAPRAR